MAIPLYIILTFLFWDLIPVRIVFCAFLLIMLDLWVKCVKWDKDDAKKAQEEKEKREYLRVLKRGKNLYIYNEPWYQNLNKNVQLEERIISPPSNSLSNSSKPKRKRKRKQSKFENKLWFYYECRCILKEPEFILSFTKSQERSAMNMKKSVKPRFHRRN